MSCRLLARIARWQQGRMRYFRAILGFGQTKKYVCFRLHVFMYESNPRMPIPPGHLTRIKYRVGGNLTFVQVPVPRAFDTMKKTSQDLVYPNNLHQYQSRQQCKGLLSILFCNHVSSVKYRKQEQILKILDTINRRSQFYNFFKIPVARNYTATRNSSNHFLNSSWLRGPATNKPGKKVKNTKISTNKARHILRRILVFFANS